MKCRRAPHPSQLGAVYEACRITGMEVAMEEGRMTTDQKGHVAKRGRRARAERWQRHQAARREQHQSGPSADPDYGPTKRSKAMGGSNWPESTTCC